jgi:AraC-like DNA-binding protein
MGSAKLAALCGEFCHPSAPHSGSMTLLQVKCLNSPLSIMQKDTVSIYFLRAAVARLSPPAKARVLQSASISAELLLSDTARVTAASFANLWLAVANELDDEFFGLCEQKMKVGSFALLCHSVVHSRNLGQAITHISRGFAIFLEDIKGVLTVEGEQATISISNHIALPASRRFADETYLVMLYGLMCWLAGKRLAPLRVEFFGAKPSYWREYTIMFSKNLSFDAPCTRIHFDAQLLDLPVVQNATTLKTFLRHAPQSVFLKYKNPHGWTMKLRRQLRLSLGGTAWPTMEDVALALHVAPTTLHRRLELEGSHYQGVKDDFRRDVGIEYLSNTPRSIVEISELLGFQDASAFRRAFKSWTGVQPSHYRNSAVL